MGLIARFVRFVWGFVVGDDWRVAVGIAVVLGAAAGLAAEHVSAWWLPPLGVVLLLADSLRRTAR
jgi:hypothetical protein